LLRFGFWREAGSSELTKEASTRSLTASNKWWSLHVSESSQPAKGPFFVSFMPRPQRVNETRVKDFFNAGRLRSHQWAHVWD
jgi:hypothetical protein